MMAAGSNGLTFTCSGPTRVEHIKIIEEPRKTIKSLLCLENKVRENDNKRKTQLLATRKCVCVTVCVSVSIGNDDNYGVLAMLPCPGNGKR